MVVIGEVLFSRQGGGDVGDIIRTIESALPKHVSDYDDRKFDGQTDEEVVHALVRDLVIEPIAIDEANAQKKVDETEVAVRDLFGEGTVKVPGLRVTKAFPYTGRRDLWRFGTGQWAA
ncbi:hypothetical protein [Novosphingobium terrae]|uniref:hypothetical protein n=1 Tax=Novosphingobium terrae TaxID=2726189 RepID=UPI0019821358|nr:hypothetical protein [Novosphingobium terrae]